MRTTKGNRSGPLYWAVVLGVMTLCAACGGEKRPPMARVQGRVTYNGHPLANATVTFIAPGAARWSFGTTNDQGEFTLTTYDNNDGALLGENVVTVVEGSAAPEQPAAGVPDPDSYFKQLEEAEKRPKKLPQRYADAGTSDLKVNVVVGENRPLIECRD